MKPHPIAARLAQARRDAGLSQRAVAARVHVAAKTICNWENGITSPVLEDAVRWAAALGMPLTLGEDEPWPHLYPPDDPRHLHDTDAAGNCKNPECGYLTDGTSADDEREYQGADQ